MVKEDTQREIEIREVSRTHNIIGQKEWTVNKKDREKKREREITRDNGGRKEETINDD